MRGRALAVAAVLVLSLAVAPVGGAVGPAADRTQSSGVGTLAGTGSATVDGAGAVDASKPCAGTIREKPENTTLLSIQGARGGGKTDAMLVGVHPNGSVVGVHNAQDNGRWWAYDVDPLPNGNLLMATTEPGITVIEEIDPHTGEHVSVHRLQNVEDAHDVDYLGDGEFVTIDKGDERNRVLVYNATKDEIVWEYRFENHPDLYPKEGGGDYGEDWTHVNDVDEIREGVFMVSVRNFDHVVAIDRETKEVVWKLGSDNDYDYLFRQHNPDYLEGENGTPTVLVADSRNDRVVEFARVDGEWVETWVLEGGDLDEPRDADRLPNGNTLVADRRGHRFLEVTPEGEVVWEVYGPWQPYDAERVGTGPGSQGPTMRQLGTTGTVELTGSVNPSTDELEACYAHLEGWDEGSQLVPGGEDPAATPTSNWTPNGSDVEYTPFTDDTDGVLEPSDERIPGFMPVAAAVAVLLAALALRRRS